MMSSRRLVLWFFATLVFGALTGCYPGYRMDVEQGNVVTPEQRAQLQLGMGRREARFVLGSPLVKDPFHTDRWDYVYSLRDGATAPLISSVSVFLSRTICWLTFAMTLAVSQLKR